MFEDNADPIGGLGKQVNDTLLEKWQSAGAVGLTALEHDDWTAVLVVGSIEPVAQWKGAIRMWLVHGFIVEVVDGD